MCRECNGVGYLLNNGHTGDRDVPGRGRVSPPGPVTLNITACYYPDCDAGVPDIASLQVGGMFTEVIRNPLDGTIMALSGFTEPDFR